ncbi:ATM interactor-like protein [Dinothrombium tinctorium]|uniref:ATM interactor-like protein n=1 Tax=Dinothrombium tinctorium TaxID=1965070 RepID=A0A3S3NV66_9ACAR|nr:ATM interactor-like protein [Dinothrombium tinctorium]RWS12868.1 ATM interactor-like protein [Dinothrombium tinctorium]
MNSECRDVNGENFTKYYCSVDGCVFSKGMGKFFKRKMLVDQHFLNTHSEKRHICPKCSKPYSIDWQLKHHLKSCGIEWKCLSCDKVYRERLSLITHCKRHSHLLPENAKIRKSKEAAVKSSTISVNVIVMPLILSAPSAKESTLNPRPILPKPCTHSNDGKDACTQTEKQSKCGCDNLNKVKLIRNECIEKPLTIGKAQTATQTEKTANKVRASRGAQCPPLRLKTRKSNMGNTCESAQTQTSESILSYINSNHLLTSSKATSTRHSPPKKSKKTSVAVETNTNFIDSENEPNTCAFLNSSNPLLSQFNIENNCESPLLSSHLTPLSNEISASSNKSFNINEQSVQTDDHKDFLETYFSNIETQTTNELNEILGFDAEDDNIFADFELNDIETQTIWNSDEMTQTDEIGESFQGIDVLDVVEFFDAGEKSIEKDPTISSSIETQTHNFDSQNLIPRYTENYF